jgi:hypothetical protein
MEVRVEKDGAGYRSRQPSTECGLADAGSARNDQQERADEGALVAAMRAPKLRPGSTAAGPVPGGLSIVPTAGIKSLQPP